MLLAIETSCDETAAAIVEKDSGGVRVRSSIVSSQIALHAAWGGVVPNLAAREHVKNIAPVIESALREANASWDDIEAIAVTAGPGLAPALQIGVIAAKTLSYLRTKPLLGIHHIEGHIYANFIGEQSTVNSQRSARNNDQGTRNERRGAIKNQQRILHSSFPILDSAPISHSSFSIPHSPFTKLFPLLALVVSGGHTELVIMRDHFDYTILGETEDDAAGEAFDKVAKMLSLPYPGGPEIAKRAELFENGDWRILNKKLTPHPETEHTKTHPPFNIQHSPFSFPRPLIDSPDYRFSFSGLKTAVLYFLKKHEDKRNDENFINAVCREFQEAALDVLIAKTRRAIIEYQPKTVIIAGGVSANTELRKRMSEMIARDFSETHFRMPPFQYSLDNAAMIGAAALFRWEKMSPEEKKKASARWQTLVPDPNLLLTF